jgi:CBS domain containing-hemolysin-like protein
MIAVLWFNRSGTPGVTGSTRPRVIESLLSDLHRVVSGVQLGITLTSLAIGADGASFVVRRHRESGIQGSGPVWQHLLQLSRPQAQGHLIFEARC